MNVSPVQILLPKDTAKKYVVVDLDSSSDEMVLTKFNIKVVWSKLTPEKAEKLVKRGVPQIKRRTNNEAEKAAIAEAAKQKVESKSAKVTQAKSELQKVEEAIQLEGDKLEGVKAEVLKAETQLKSIQSAIQQREKELETLNKSIEQLTTDKGVIEVEIEALKKTKEGAEKSEPKKASPKK